jgi:polysaccharide pyruvyl transferase WcaK-like protein
VPGYHEWIAGSGDVAGVNASGLIFNDDAGARRFGLRTDYRRLMARIVAALLDRGARVVLVPHVVSVGKESDEDAARAIHGALTPAQQASVHVLPSLSHPGEVKFLIGGLAWFCGTRMHSTIAALSLGVPTASVAYSMKAQGVFEACGQGARVADARQLDEDEVLEIVLRSWDERDEIRRQLTTTIPAVLRQVDDQMDCIVAMSLAGAGGHRPTGLRRRGRKP